MFEYKHMKERVSELIFCLKKNKFRCLSESKKEEEKKRKTIVNDKNKRQ